MQITRTLVRKADGTEETTKIEYDGYTITPFKHSQAFFIKGEYVYDGWRVSKGMTNPMPGATWFQSADDALRGLQIFLLAERINEGRPGFGKDGYGCDIKSDDTHTFWLLMDVLKGKD